MALPPRGAQDEVDRCRDPDDDNEQDEPLIKY
jgi:hypothetical protein